MKFILVKKRAELDQYGEFDDNESMVVARVYNADMAKYKRELLNALADFKVVNRELR